MKKLIAAAFGLALLAAPATVSAQGRPDQGPQHGQNHGKPQPGPGHAGPGRPGPGTEHGQGPGRPNQYGNWDNRWGARPGNPPRNWNNRGGWYRHVRACQQRFRSYNPRTDTYQVRRGVVRRCTL